ncbi:hypothetical protein MRB53_005053 [Persea americana]|uniref:Uncharacterized protein n=1 Tax=Persea americana TaxID=3435 RepID=A0ACC2MCC1_PERAE|nr:hypothetical protein MRB53_005053 [Persea americana]|eukprot:TRINITY_DN7531_c0_g2_i1.p1 TRINITY_DN7531_c0_g2~~TRINITY_DN7531_c0_g2_i1.p1  ORF type:complete len:174 (-),score=31.97 TRINITY_DN7531_c0_g2_i1:368-889(-)
MQQRKAAPGRPSGTDGSDFSYRMVVDPRYRKVAEAKSRLLLLIILQSVGQVAGVLWAILWALEEKGLDMLGFLSIFIGSVSIVAGELGRRWSNVSLLKLYITGLSVATVVSVACVVRSDLSVKVLQDQNSSLRKKLEVVAEAGHVLLSVPVQIFAFITAVSLMQNMSLKRASR